MKVGDLVRDSGTNELVMIVAEQPFYRSSGGGLIKWDFQVYHDDQGFYYVDSDELDEI